MADTDILKRLFPANKLKRAASAGASKIRRIIIDRTFDGEFGPESNPGGAPRGVEFYNPEYAQRHGKSQFPVTLSRSNNPKAGMLGAMRATFEVRGDSLEMGISMNNRADKIRLYHEELGAGPSRIRRQFVYLSQQEKRRVFKIVSTILKS